MNTQYKILTLILLSFIPIVGSSQLKEEILNVGKKKNPEVNIKDIQKKKTNPDRYPPADENTVVKKDSLNYTIVDVPAASEFQTSQLPPQSLDTNFKNYYLDNYAKIGYGTRNTLLGDVYFNYPINHNLTGIKFSSLYTDGPKNKYDWKTSSSNIDVEAFYILKLKTGKLHFAGNYTYNGSNYYGLSIPELYATSKMNLKQNTNQLTFKSDYDTYINNFLDKASLKAGHWWDKFNSKESFVDINAKLAKSPENANLMLPGLNFGADADILLNYTYTRFGLDTKNKYSYLTAEFSPVLQISSLGSYLKIGANIAYNGELEGNNTKIFFHPKVEFLFHAAREISVYAGINGGLKLNSMSELSIENPYLYSNQILKPTNTLYKTYAGIKGDVGESIKYEVEASFSKAENLWLYMRNPYDISLPPVLKPYNRLNTFNAVYDDGNIITIKGALQYFCKDDLNIGLEGEYNNYNLDNFKNAYHLPEFKVGIDGSYKTFQNKLKLETKLFFIGARKSNYYLYNPTTFTINEGITTLDSYVDLNLSAYYQILNNFSIFVHGTNLFSKNYERFQGYKVLGAQAMGGILIQF